MAAYDGPSFFKHTKRQSQNPSTNRLKENLQAFQSKDQDSEDTDLFSERNSHTLPDQIIKRDEIEKGFQDYLNDKKTFVQTNRSKHYVEPPFEVSKVPSPIFGYKKPLKKDGEVWDYSVLKEELKKESFEFLLYEKFETPELSEYWEKQGKNAKEKIQNEEPNSIEKQPEKYDADQTSNSIKEVNHIKLKQESQSTRNKRMRLQRSLMNIIQEEQLGKNETKRDLPGFFSDKNE